MIAEDVLLWVVEGQEIEVGVISRGGLAVHELEARWWSARNGMEVVWGSLRSRRWQRHVRWVVDEVRARSGRRRHQARLW